MKEKIYNIYCDLVKIMTVSGYCARNAKAVVETVKKYTGEIFDSVEVSSHGSVVFTAKCEGVYNPRTFAVDAHIDTVGMTVNKILPGGFVSVTNCGGIDARILPSSEVTVFCNDGSSVTGIFTSVPPHLHPKNEAPKLSDIFVDTGLDDETLGKKVKIGSPVSFVAEPSRLSGDIVCGPYLDDKLCAAAAICAFSEIDKKSLACNACLVLSSGEESNGSGAAFASRKSFDSALVLDVNFARDSGVQDFISAPIGKGISISFSAGTSMKLTSHLEDLLVKNALPYTKIIEVTDTGTNATRLGCMNLGTPCAIASIPVSYMHTPVETASLFDAAVLCKTVDAALCDGMTMTRRIIKA